MSRHSLSPLVPSRAPSPPPQAGRVAGGSGFIFRKFGIQLIAAVCLVVTGRVRSQAKSSDPPRCEKRPHPPRQHEHRRAFFYFSQNRRTTDRQKGRRAAFLTTAGTPGYQIDLTVNRHARRTDGHIRPTCRDSNFAASLGSLHYCPLLSRLLPSRLSSLPLPPLPCLITMREGY